MNALDLGYGVAAVVTAPLWMRKTRSGWAQRFARVVPELPPREPGVQRIMLHAVSVGEVNALREIVPLLGKHAQVVVTASTDTGFARAQSLFGAQTEQDHRRHSCSVARFPLDGSWMVSRFLDAVKPDVVGLVELEIWPNFVRACQKRAIPVAVINGRLSERSFRGYRRIARWISPSFTALSIAAVQNEAYAQRFVDMGVAANRCVLTGSMKFDSVQIADDVPGAEKLADALGIDPSKPLIVAGSTGPGEEAMLYAIWKTHLRAHGVQLLCAPRKPERFDQAAAALPGCVRRTCPQAKRCTQKNTNERSNSPESTAVHGSENRAAANQNGKKSGAGLFLPDTIGERGRA